MAWSIDAQKTLRNVATFLMRKLCLLTFFCDSFFKRFFANFDTGYNQIFEPKKDVQQINLNKYTRPGYNAHAWIAGVKKNPRNAAVSHLISLCVKGRIFWPTQPFLNGFLQTIVQIMRKFLNQKKMYNKSI